MDLPCDINNGADWMPTDENAPENSPDHSGRSLLNLFMDMAEDSLLLMIRCMNQVGNATFPLLWRDLDIPNTSLFLALLFHFDENPRNDLRDYWRGEPYGDPFVKSCGISLGNFTRWYKCIRLYDPTAITEDMKCLDKAYKVREYLHRVEASCQRMYNPPDPNFSCDEEMAGYVVSH